MSHPKRAIAAMKVLVVAGLLVGCANWTFGDVVPATSAKSNNLTSVDATLQPEIASLIRRNTDVYTQKTVVASANPLASQAGLAILQAGGTAVDAAIAIQMVLGLVEPQSSGIGGGAFLLHSRGVGPTRLIEAFDGRETAPSGASETLFLNANGQPIPFFEALVGGQIGRAHV